MNRDVSGLLALMDHLAVAVPEQAQGRWQTWQIERVGGGMNNRLFRVQRDGEDYAIKFTMRDRRDRAGREWWALNLLRGAGFKLAPEPVWLDRNRYKQPVIVQTWLSGSVDDKLPEAEGEWEKLLAHLLAIHTLKPAPVRQRLLGHPMFMGVMRHLHAFTSNQMLPGLRPVVLHVTNAVDARAQIRWQMAQIPEPEQPRELQRLVERTNRTSFPTWRAPAQTFCRADPNIRNFIRRPETWVSVDWEYSGWGDPAFEIADFVTHIAHLDVPETRWIWFVDRYCAASSDSACAERIAVYRVLMLVWWCARMARYLYETGQGLDRRLVESPADWQETKRRQYQHYVRRAEAALDAWGG